MVDQHRRTPGFRRLLEGERESKEIAVAPPTAGELDAKRQSIVVASGGNTDRRDADAIDPRGVAVWASAPLTLLQRRQLVVGRHLDCRIHQAVETIPLKRLVVRRQRLTL